MIIVPPGVSTSAMVVMTSSEALIERGGMVIACDPALDEAWLIANSSDLADCSFCEPGRGFASVVRMGARAINAVATELVMNAAEQSGPPGPNGTATPPVIDQINEQLREVSDRLGSEYEFRIALRVKPERTDG